MNKKKTWLYVIGSVLLVALLPWSLPVIIAAVGYLVYRHHQSRIGRNGADEAAADSSPSPAKNSPIGFAVIDFETTAFSPKHGDVVEAAVVLVNPDGTITDRWTSLIKPQGPMRNTQFHGISAEMVASAPTFSQVAPTLARLLTGRVIVAHNAPFDMRFLMSEAQDAGLKPSRQPGVLCTMQMADRYLPSRASNKLVDCAAAAEVPPYEAHSALEDATTTARLLSTYIASAPKHDKTFWRAIKEMAFLRWTCGGHEVPAVSRGDVARADAEAAEAVRAERVAAAQSLAARRPAARRPQADGPTEAYLDVVDRVLEDRFITDDEWEQLADVAADLGLTAPQRSAAHRLYVAALASALAGDGQVSPSEREDLAAVARLLRIRKPSVDEFIQDALTSPASAAGTDIVRGPSLRPGQRVRFHGALATPAPELEAKAEAAGLLVLPSLRGKVDILVTGLADSRANDDRVARTRERGIRVLTEPVFLALLADLEAEPVEYDADLG